MGGCYCIYLFPLEFGKPTFDNNKKENSCYIQQEMRQDTKWKRGLVLVAGLSFFFFFFFFSFTTNILDCKGLPWLKGIGERSWLWLVFGLELKGNQGREEVAVKGSESVLERERCVG
jgi:hypothetical protein